MKLVSGTMNIGIGEQFFFHCNHCEAEYGRDIEAKGAYCVGSCDNPCQLYVTVYAGGSTLVESNCPTNEDSLCELSGPKLLKYWSKAINILKEEAAHKQIALSSFITASQLLGEE